MRSTTALQVLCATTAILSAAPLSATVLGFDDINASAGDVILTSYQGYSFTNVSVYTSTPGFPGYNNGIVSGPNAAYTAGDAGGAPLISTITASSPFNFNSGYFGSGWYNGLNVTVQGLSNGSPEYSQTFTVNTSGPQLETLNFSGINELEISSSVTSATTDPYSCGSSSCSQVTFDNLTLTPAVVPEINASSGASAIALLAGILLVFRGRRIAGHNASASQRTY